MRLDAAARQAPLPRRLPPRPRLGSPRRRSSIERDQRFGTTLRPGRRNRRRLRCATAALPGFARADPPRTNARSRVARSTGGATMDFPSPASESDRPPRGSIRGRSGSRACACRGSAAAPGRRRARAPDRGNRRHRGLVSRTEPPLHPGAAHQRAAAYRAQASLCPAGRIITAQF